jgi:hypothetical protein
LDARVGHTSSRGADALPVGNSVVGVGEHDEHRQGMAKPQLRLLAVEPEPPAVAGGLLEVAGTTLDLDGQETSCPYAVGGLLDDGINALIALVLFAEEPLKPQSLLKD